RDVEVAELAARDTHVGVVDVAVDDVGDDPIGMKGLAALIGRTAQRHDIRAVMQVDALGQLEALALGGPREQVLDPHGASCTAGGTNRGVVPAARELNVNLVVALEPRNGEEARLAGAGEVLDEAL